MDDANYGERDEPAQPHLPDIIIEALTDDQIATMALIGGEEVAERIEVALFCPTPPALLKLNPNLHPNVVHRHKCPILMYRGRARRIRPNGDIEEVDLDRIREWREQSAERP